MTVGREATRRQPTRHMAPAMQIGREAGCAWRGEVFFTNEGCRCAGPRPSGRHKTWLPGSRRGCWLRARLGVGCSVRRGVVRHARLLDGKGAYMPGAAVSAPLGGMAWRHASAGGGFSIGNRTARLLCGPAKAGPRNFTMRIMSTKSALESLERFTTHSPRCQPATATTATKGKILVKQSLHSFYTLQCFANCS